MDCFPGKFCTHKNTDYMKSILFIIAVLFGLQLNAQETITPVPGKFVGAIPVLNMGTFHMGYTSDAHSTDFDEHSRKNREQVHQIAKSIAAFKPTVIVVEYSPKYNAGLQKEFMEYVANPDMKFKAPTEIELLAYEVGRLAGTKKIYGIDYQEGYNYMINRFVKNNKDSATFNRYMQWFTEYKNTNPEQGVPVLELLKRTNSPEVLDMLLNINADILTHIASPGKAEGADEAAKYYHRNLVMYSNLNQIELTENDRVFLLMGASHTAFFNDFMRRSPKYKLVDVFEYLK